MRRFGITMGQPVSFGAAAATPATSSSPYRDTVLAQSPLIYWRSDLAYDLSGNGVHPLANGRPLVGQDSIMPSEEGRAVSFQANSSQYLASDDDQALVTGDLSITMWIRIDGTLQTRFVFGVAGTGESSTENYLYGLWLWGSSWRYFHESGSGVDTSLILTPSAANVSGTVYHLGLVRDATAKTVSLYINGTLEDSDSYTLAPDGGSAAQLYLGGGITAPPTFTAQDSAVWNRILTPEEIAAQYGAGL